MIIATALKKMETSDTQLKPKWNKREQTNCITNISVLTNILAIFFLHSASISVHRFGEGCFDCFFTSNSVSNLFLFVWNLFWLFDCTFNFDLDLLHKATEYCEFLPSKMLIIFFMDEQKTCADLK